MKSFGTIPFPPRCCIALVMGLIALAMPSSLLSTAGGAQSPGSQDRESVQVLLSIAESQYEIVKLLIKQQRFDRVLPEMKKIFELKLPNRYEQAVAESASLVARLLVENSQFEPAHDVLNEALARMTDDRNKAALLKIQALVYKEEGRIQEAMDVLERAIAIEKRLIRP